MPFIGNKPTAIPLSADDLEDNIISTAKIQDNAVTAAKYIEPIPFRNIIINGDMSIAQRATSTSSITGDGYHTVDRFNNEMNTAGTWTQSQSTDVPTGQGFATSLKYDCTTANGSLSAGSFGFLSQRFEGQNLQYLKYGTSSAESLTLSFWVKSNKTGTYIVEMVSFATTKSQSQSYTISSADTWEKKTLTFTGDTATAIANNNARSFNLNFWLVAGTTYTSGTLNTSYNTTTNANRSVGQVNLADSTSNEWYVTGVQLEAGTTASDFEFLPYDVNLQRCQRYFEQMDADYPGFSAGTKGASTGYTVIFKTTKRATPTMSDVTLRNSQAGTTATVSASGSGWTFESGARYATSGTTGSTGDGMHVYASNGIQADAEL